MAVAVEVQPHVVQRGDHAGIRASLEEHGYALVRNCATESELQRARALLWQHLDAAHGWKEGRPETWTDDAYVSAAAPFASSFEATEKRLHRARTGASPAS